MQKKCIQLVLLKIIEKFLSLHFNGANSYLFVIGTEIHKFKAKNYLLLQVYNNLLHTEKDS